MAYTYQTQPVEFITSLGFDIGSMDIPNGVSIQVDFELAKKEFCIMTSNEDLAISEGFRPLVKEMRLLVPCLKLSETLFNTFNTRIKTHPYIIPHYRTEVITHTVGVNKTTYETDRLFVGSSGTPAKVVIGFVSTAAYLGKYSLNPFEFMYSFGGATETDPTVCQIKKQKLTLNGNTIDGLDNSSVLLSYVKMQKILNMLDTGFSNSITRSKFVGGSYLMPYDLTTNPGWSTSNILMPKVRDGQYRYFLKQIFVGKRNKF